MSVPPRILKNKKNFLCLAFFSFNVYLNLPLITHRYQRAHLTHTTAKFIRVFWGNYHTSRSRKHWVTMCRELEEHVAGAHFIILAAPLRAGSWTETSVGLDLLASAGMWTCFCSFLYDTLITTKDIMSAQGLLSSVFSCSLSPRSLSKTKLRQTRSLETTLMRHSGTEAEETPCKVCGPISSVWPYWESDSTVICGLSVGSCRDNAVFCKYFHSKFKTP